MPAHRIARLIAVIAGIAGVVLCGLVPLMPVKQTTATIAWPQGNFPKFQPAGTPMYTVTVSNEEQVAGMFFSTAQNLTINAIGSGALIASRLFGVRPWDPALLVRAALLLVAATLVAAFIPARRAAGLDPIRALRIE